MAAAISAVLVSIMASQSKIDPAPAMTLEPLIDAKPSRASNLMIGIPALSIAALADMRSPL